MVSHFRRPAENIIAILNLSSVRETFETRDREFGTNTTMFTLK